MKVKREIEAQNKNRLCKTKERRSKKEEDVKEKQN